MQAILAKGKVVAPVDVLLRMGWLTPEGLSDWRFRRVPYLEKVLGANLIKLSRALRILRMYAHTLKLKPSHTAYVSHGGRVRVPLRFTKTGDRALEEAYSRHFVWPGKGPFHMPGVKVDAQPGEATDEGDDARS